MVAEERSLKKYVVRLSGEERERLEGLLHKGKRSARQQLKARILLKADVSDAGEGWSDNQIITALGTTPSTHYRVRKQLVEEGLDAVLSRKQRAAFLPTSSQEGAGAGHLINLLQRQFPDVGVKRLHVHGRRRRLGLRFAAKYRGRTLQELVLPLFDLVGMHIELAAKARSASSRL